jgi:DNA-binding response OmpR family regulator
MNTKKKILILDDEIGILRAVDERLKMENFLTATFTTAEEALSGLPSVSPDLMIVDIRLPGMSGLDFCKKVRALPGALGVIPILFLTTAKDETSKVLGLEIGGDDYMTKPFSPLELSARVRALLRRTAPNEEKEEIFSSGKLTINIERHEVKAGNKDIELSPKEFDLLVLFLQKKGRVLTRPFLMECVWGVEYDTSTRTIDTHIKELRRELGPLGKSIVTVEGLGYKWEEDV